MRTRFASNLRDWTPSLVSGLQNPSLLTRNCISSRSERLTFQRGYGTLRSIPLARLRFGPPGSGTSIHASPRRPAVPTTFPLICSYHTTQRGRRWVARVGAEPGIDPETYDAKTEQPTSQPDIEAEIRVIDFSDSQIAQHSLTHLSLDQFLNEQPKPDWASCRWIYVNGLNLDVMRCLGNHQDLHPLAIEDVMDAHTPTKVDWYDGHCYLEMNMAKLLTIEEHHDSIRAKGPKSGPLGRLSPEPSVLNRSQRSPRWRTLSPKKLAMSVEQVSAFLTADDTVITMFEHSGKDVLAPILTRLESPKTVVRSSNDPSILLQAVIDAVVDLSLPIGKAVAEEFEMLEMAVLTAPKIAQSKRLHVLRSGLTFLTDNTIALSGLVRTLCDHRAVPIPQPTDGRVGNESVLSHQLPTSVNISPLAQVYLKDVQDHVTALTNSTQMSIRSAEHLTSLIFSTIAADQNESVRRLTLVSSFFLPLTFLTGYFGMNFDPMPVVQDNSDIYFWKIAIPVMLTTIIAMSLRSAWYRASWQWVKRRRPGHPH